MVRHDDPRSSDSASWAATLEHLNKLRYSQLDGVRNAHRRTGPVLLVDYICDVVGEFEKVLHFADTGEGRRECLACSEAIPAFILTVLEELGLQRVGKKLPSPRLYCRRNPTLLRRLLLKNWPGAGEIVAPIATLGPVRRLEVWELDPQHREMIDRIGRDVLQARRGRRGLRRALRLVLNRYLRKSRISLALWRHFVSGHHWTLVQRPPASVTR